MAFDTVDLENVGSEVSIFIDDLGQLANQQPPYFRLGQATYLPPNDPVTVFRDGAVELSLDRGQLKKLIDAGQVTVS